MDLSALNKLIVEHLRYYGFQVAARIVESEIKGNKCRIAEKPSKLLEIVIKGSSGFEVPIQQNRLFNGGKNDSTVINASEDIFSNNINEIKQEYKKNPAFNGSFYATPDKLVGMPRNIPLYGNTDGKKKEHSEGKDYRRTFGEKYPGGEDLAFKPVGGKPRPNDLSSIAKILDQYPYGNAPQNLMNKTRTRDIDSLSDKPREAVRFPMLETDRTKSMGAPQNVKSNLGQNANTYFQGSENGEEDEVARKVRDPNDLNKFIPYSFNAINNAKVTPNNPRGQRSISVPRKEQQLHEHEIPNFNQNGFGYGYGNRNSFQPQPPKEIMNNRATSVLKPIPNLNKSFLGKKMTSEEENEDASDVHSKTVDYSLLNREPDSSPLNFEGVERKGVPPRPITKAPEYESIADKVSLNQGDPRESIAFKPSALITPKKVTKPPFEGLGKGTHDTEYVPFRKAEESFRSPNTTNSLIKNNALDLSRNQPKIYERPNHLRDTQTKRDERTHSLPPPQNDHRSQFPFNPLANTDDKINDFGRQSPYTHEICPEKGTRDDMLREFSYPSSNKQAEPVQNNYRNQKEDEEHSHRVFDSFGPASFEKAKQSAQNQLQISSAFPQNNFDYSQGQINHTNSNYVNQEHSQRMMADREISFDPFSHTFYPDKNSMPNSTENGSNIYQQKSELSQKTLEYLKNTTKLTEKEIQEGFDVYVQVLNPKRNPELLMNKEKFVEYMRKMRGIMSPSFSEACFNFAVSSLSNDRNIDKITYREVGQMLDLMHPGHPFSFMKFLFKLYQGDEKRILLKEFEAPLRGLSSGQLYEMALLLRSSLDYIYEKQNDANARLTFEEYLGYVQDFEPMKIYS